MALNQKEAIYGVTGTTFARACTRFGFRSFTPKQTIFTDFYRALLRHDFDQSNKKFGTNINLSEPLAVVFMPTSDLLETYDKPTISRAGVQRLASVARSEMKAENAATE